MLKRLVLGGLCAGLAFGAPNSVAGQNGADPVSESIRAQYELVKTNVVASAQQMPEDLYGFQATEEVRTFGELIGHLAFAQFNICAGLRGEANPRADEGNLEQTLHSKADLVRAIEEAFAFCDPAYAEATDASMGDQVQFFGNQAVRHYPMTFALVHAYEHYGNIVTYMRLNDMVPPSSQGS
jgi:uncharacterized damage-inducible protein DinB